MADAPLSSDPAMEPAMARALTLIHGCVGLLGEGWPVRGLSVARLEALLGGVGRARR